MGFEIINILKKEKGMTNAQIANMAGITLSTLDKITSGVNTNPKLDTLLSICGVLGCTLNDFMDQPLHDMQKPTPVSEDGLNEEEKQVLYAIKGLTPAQQTSLLAFLKTILGQNQQTASAAQHSADETSQ